MNNFKNDILNKIKSGEVDMKPRWHFVLKSLLMVLGLITVALLVVYVLSFVLFVLRQSGVGFMPLYGFRGVSMFVMNSPWLLIASAGALLVVLQLLVHKYSFSFRQPLLYSLIGIVVLVLLGAYAIGQTQFHPRLQGLAEGRGVPVFGALYRGMDDRQPENITFGTITELGENSLVLESDTGETLTVLLTPDTKQPRQQPLATGQAILVFGEREGDTITAFGIRPHRDDAVRPSPRPEAVDGERPPRPAERGEKGERGVFGPPTDVVQ